MRVLKWSSQGWECLEEILDIGCVEKLIK